MDKRSEVMQSLYLCKRHLCCDEAEYYLYPPNRGGGPFELEVGTMTVFPKACWDIDDGYGGSIIKVQYCPWCGEKLEDEDVDEKRT